MEELDRTTLLRENCRWTQDPVAPARILIVEDNSSTQVYLRSLLQDSGYAIECANDFSSAQQQLNQRPYDFDLILLDRMLSGEDGIDLLLQLKAQKLLKNIPVIIHSALDSKEDILAGIRAGAYYYIPKPLKVDVFLSVVETAMQERHRHKRLAEWVGQNDQTIALMEAATFNFRTPQQCVDIATTLAKACPDPKLIVSGLIELMINAIEHGNLGISFHEKGILLKESRWVQEVERRLSLKQNQENYARITFLRNEGAIRFTIQDTGDGFDWKQYEKKTLEHVINGEHGRGIAIASASFDRILYRGNGNEVQCVVALGGE